MYVRDLIDICPIDDIYIVHPGDNSPYKEIIYAGPFHGGFEIPTVFHDKIVHGIFSSNKGELHIDI